MTALRLARLCSLAVSAACWGFCWRGDTLGAAAGAAIWAGALGPPAVVVPALRLRGGFLSTPASI